MFGFFFLPYFTVMFSYDIAKRTVSMEILKIRLRNKSAKRHKHNLLVNKNFQKLNQAHFSNLVHRLDSKQMQ